MCKHREWYKKEGLIIKQEKKIHYRDSFFSLHESLVIEENPIQITAANEIYEFVYNVP
jgi:hypothetical protein